MDDDFRSSPLNEPLLAGTDDDSDDDEEFRDAHSSASSIVSSISKQSRRGLLSDPLPSTAATQHHSQSSTSYYGTASKLATGSLFPNTQGVVDSIPSTDEKPCLIFADNDIYSAIAHICLLEKEVYNNVNNSLLWNSGGNGTYHDELPLHPKLFSVVHACKPLIKHDDAGMRILKKLSKGSHANPEIPVLLHENNILRETSEVERKRNGLSGLLLPRFIDESIGAKHILCGSDGGGVTSYNMNLFIQRHAALPNLFHSLLTSPSPTHRIELSTKLLSLLKVINSDLQLFPSGPYLCGEQFTLADISIFPIIERIVVVLSTYRNFWIPPSLTNLIRWYEVMCDRPAIRVATADRTDESMHTYCYEKWSRNEYLLEVYECIALHEEEQFQQLNDDVGRAGVNVYREVMCEEVDDRDRMALCERGKSSCEQCVIS
mmetsp:Transcript_3238/g.5438  ORF Transcript_3238/g.5438 Transcript_3238/m.5438 type:complete len:432 (+) Transcript_3238:32-1327(+)